MKKHSLENKVRFSRQSRGFTLIELMITVAILAVVSSIAAVSYNGYIDTTNNASAVQQIRILALIINDYAGDHGQYPDSLSDISSENLLDPWGNPYNYLKIEGASVGKVRKDHNLVPLNTTYDLYSSGKDQKSQPPLTASASRDDIVYANDGGFVGLASDY